MVLPIGCPRSVGFLAGFCLTESQSPHYCPVRGSWLQMTGALQIDNNFETINIDW